jgi:hypothetical protein
MSHKQDINKNVLPSAKTVYFAWALLRGVCSCVCVFVFVCDVYEVYNEH